MFKFSFHMLCYVTRSNFFAGLRLQARFLILALEYSHLAHLCLSCSNTPDFIYLANCQSFLSSRGCIRAGKLLKYAGQGELQDQGLESAHSG